MCRSVVVLETIKKSEGHGGMTQSQLLLAEAQAEDMSSMKKEIQDIKSDMAGLKTDVTGISGKLDLLIEQQKNKTFLEITKTIITSIIQITKEIINKKGFWVVLALMAIGKYGIDLQGLKELINK